MELTTFDTTIDFCKPIVVNGYFKYESELVSGMYSHVSQRLSIPWEEIGIVHEIIDEDFLRILEEKLNYRDGAIVVYSYTFGEFTFLVEFEKFMECYLRFKEYARNNAESV